MAHESIVTLTQENFEEEVLKSEVPVLVDFWAEWCMPCKAIAPVLDQVAEEIGETAKVGKVDVTDNTDLAAQYGIRSIPNFLIFKGGEVARQEIGAAFSKGDFVKMLSEAS